jgi:hypothetical protein
LQLTITQSYVLVSSWPDVHYSLTVTVIFVGHPLWWGRVCLCQRSPSWVRVPITVSDLILPFSLLSMTRRVMVEVFDPASTRVYEKVFTCGTFHSHVFSLGASNVSAFMYIFNKTFFNFLLKPNLIPISSLHSVLSARLFNKTCFYFLSKPAIYTQ